MQVQGISFHNFQVDKRLELNPGWQTCSNFNEIIVQNKAPFNLCLILIDDAFLV